MEKIIDFKGVFSYYCSLCDVIHKKRKKSIFKKHKHYGCSKKSRKGVVSLIKIIDFHNINQYYCSICKTIHRKSIFELDKLYAYKLSSSELFKFKLKRSLKNYSIKQHKLTSGSKKQ